MDPENILKGRMAESLVEELLRESESQVYRLGYESILQNLTQLRKVFDRYSEVGKQIRCIPDFLVVNKEGKPFFIEVKFRKNPEWDLKDLPILEQIDKFWNAKIIFVNCSKPPYFRVCPPPYFDKDNKPIFLVIEEDKDLFIEKETLKKFDAIVEKYFSVVITKPKIG
jgi:hypothetical protein